MVSTFIPDPKQTMSMIDRCVKTYDYYRSVDVVSGESEHRVQYNTKRALESLHCWSKKNCGVMRYVGQKRLASGLWRESWHHGSADASNAEA